MLEARGKVLVKLNVAAADLDAVIAQLPAMKTPTVNELYGDSGYAVETVVAKSRDQHPDPGPQGRRRDRHPRAAALQDRPLMPSPLNRAPLMLAAGRTGVVASFDDPRGIGVVRGDDGADYPFHCTAIADGTRQIDEGVGGELRRASPGGSGRGKPSGIALALTGRDLGRRLIRWLSPK